MFGLFKSQTAQLELTPRNSLVVALLYCMGADGEIDPEEVAHLSSVLGAGASQAQLDACVRYVRSTPADAFLAAAAPRLRREQRLCILLNMVDAAMTDGEAEPGEQRLIMSFAQAFEIAESDLEPHFRTLVAKNDRAVLDR